jgi:hypothetical protein
MAVNNNGNLLDTAGEVAIDFVWGNFPMQPNDARPDTAAGRLDPALAEHITALSGWNGYPQYSPNTTGEDVAGATNYVLVPSVIGLTTALATDAMKDASLVPTTASAAANVAGVVTAVSRTAGSTTATITDASHGFVTGNKVTISNTGEATVNGTFSVTRLTDNTFTITSTGTTVLALTGLTAAVVAVAGTIKSQSTAAGAASVATTATITITPWAAAS